MESMAILPCFFLYGIVARVRQEMRAFKEEYARSGENACVQIKIRAFSQIKKEKTIKRHPLLNGWRSKFYEWNSSNLPAGEAKR
ncbi:hypothetical protein BN1080_02480 [Planococcus massiliensis]|uniref:Uncharacterized protein n=1 Tax=Planococcus massiliensis TaxID=1499687 RepID=A0A098ENX7_9BACL|nr:hypothetical protein BN1080_02480 [Planococcus massiliensis]